MRPLEGKGGRRREEGVAGSRACGGTARLLVHSKELTGSKSLPCQRSKSWKREKAGETYYRSAAVHFSYREQHLG